MTWHAAMETLVEGLWSQEGSRRLGCCGGTFAEPEHACDVVRERVDGAFRCVDVLGDNVVVAEVAAQFEVAVHDGSARVVA